MYEQYRADPAAVGDAWQEFFSDYRSTAVDHSSQQIQAAVNGTTATSVVPPITTTTTPTTATTAPVAAAVPIDDLSEPIRGAGAAIAANMVRSLTVPTATSFRNVPAKLLEVNRKVINGYRTRAGQSKISFTHIIGYAIARAIADAVPQMNSTFVEDADGKPRIIHNASVQMGLAVDVAKSDGSRTLVVPVLRDADKLTFDEFLASYEDLVRKVKNNKLTIADFQGATITLTNPGTIGTVQSVPGLVSVTVAPWKSATVSLLFLTLRMRSSYETRNSSKESLSASRSTGTVSYTHLTLPTILRV